MIKKIISILMLLLFVGPFGFAGTAMSQEQDIAGTIFGDPVSQGNYYFVLRVILSFSTPWGSIPSDREQLEKRMWDDLILSYEAHRRQISAGRDELEIKISETLKGSNVSFYWKEGSDAYAQWTQETLGVSVEMFENQMRHLVQLKKLHAQILDSINPSVSEEEAFQEFLNEHNSLSVELAEFAELEEAQAFYQKAKREPELWDQEAEKDKERAKGDRSFRRPGFVALEFLMHMWKFPKEAVYAMIEMKSGDFYHPTPIYKGYGAFKVLEVRRADESEFSKRRESYFDQIRSRKKYQGFKVWMEDLRQKADIQVFIEPPSDLLP